MGGLYHTRCLGGHDRACDLPPHLESLPHLVTVFGGREEVASRSKVLRNRTIRGEKALRLPGRLESLQAPLPRACRLVRVFGTVVERAMLAMLYTWEKPSLGRAVAFELVGDDDPRHIGQVLQQLAEKLLGSLLIPAALDQHVEHGALLIDRSPEVVPCTVDREKDFTQVPRIAGLGSPTPELLGR